MYASMPNYYSFTGQYSKHNLHKPVSEYQTPFTFTGIGSGFCWSNWWWTWQCWQL